RTYPPGKVAEAIWAKYRYDTKGNLVQAESSEKQVIRLEYDENGRVSELIPLDGNRIRFTYNSSSKPIEIALVKPDKSVQRIVVEYDENNKIKKVESPEGREVALKVTTAFKQLLDIIRPAGLNLGL